MYLYFPDGDSLDLSVENIKKLSEDFWANPCLLPPEMREHVDFKTCAVCPFRGQDVLCSAMKPLIPFLEQIEKYLSHDRVTAIYVRKNGEILIAETTLQKALQFVTNMALFEYCENAKQFRAYFRGILPFMSLEEAIARLIMNINWLNRNEPGKAGQVIADLRNYVTVTSKSCIKRLGVMCKSDAFRNAYVKTQTFTEFLAMAPEVLTEKFFAEQG
jgi:hypothetical protein